MDRRHAAVIASVVLVFASLLTPRPAAAATGCLDASFSAESVFLALQPGDTGQFSVMFQNTGSCAWVKGTGTQVNLAQGLPLNSPSPNSCWASNWLSPTAYATTTQQVVPVAGIASFIYSVIAPANVPPATYRFDGDLVAASTGQPLNPQGYYQAVTVAQPAGAILGGKVTAELTGAAVANASVQAYKTSDVLASNSIPFVGTITDACGYYTFGRASTLPADSYRVGVVPPAGSNLFQKFHQNGYIVYAASDVLVPAGSTTIIDLALSPIRTIAGSTKTGAGSAVAGVEVFVIDANQTCNGPSGSCGNFGYALTNATGVFVASVPRGDFYLSFGPPAGLGLDSEAWKNRSGPPFDTVSTVNGNATGVDLVFRPTVNGRVSAPGGGVLAEDVSVQIHAITGGTCVVVASTIAYGSRNGSWAVALNASPSATLYALVVPFYGSSLPIKWWQNTPGANPCITADPISWTGSTVGNIDFILP